MADRMQPTAIEVLARWIEVELDQKQTVFGLPAAVFHRPWSGDGFASHHAGGRLDTPLGVAAGPHTQLAQNLVCAYLAGARFIELKTVQTLDRIDVSKPCIDMQDVGYNCEWSQELRIEQSFAEYLKAWILIHWLRRRLDLGRGPDAGLLFNMSVGYDLEGIGQDQVQWFLDRMHSAGRRRRELLRSAAATAAGIADVEVPDQLSDSVTLSTMHGCPPDEIERIGRYLIEQRGLHTAIKLNPTLLGPERLRHILHGELGFDDIAVPDAAFEHDPDFAAGVDMVRSLQAAADKAGVRFWVKLTNTLETRNLRRVLPEHEPMHYMSGRALHPLAVQLAAELTGAVERPLAVSLSGGADAYNLSDLLASGLGPVTVCSDLLRPGGYGRLSQYLERLGERMQLAGAADLFELGCRRAQAADDGGRRLEALLRQQVAPLVGRGRAGRAVAAVRDALAGPASRSLRTALVAAGRKLGLNRQPSEALAEEVGRVCRRIALEQTAARTRRNPRYHKPHRRRSTKTEVALGPFDCSFAPCSRGCPAGQDVPGYMQLAARGAFDEALAVVLRDNPLPATTGAICDHPCMEKCVRNHYDAPLRIRGIKRAIVERARTRPAPEPAAASDRTVAVVGAGPAGLSAAWNLALAGCSPVVFDAQPEPGGLPAELIPHFRLADDTLAADVEQIRRLGVDFRFGTEVGRDVAWQELVAQHAAVFVGIGAHCGMELRIADEDCDGVVDCLDLLSRTKRQRAPELGRRVLVIGGGNSAMDAARTARRLVGPRGEVTVVYRRSLAQMPADDEEIAALQAEGVALRELEAPVRVVSRDGRVRGLECVSMELGPADASGRPRPVPVEGSEHVIEADSIIVAIGQRPAGALFDQLERLGAERDRWGALVVDGDSGQTSLDGIYAGGDAVRGGGSIIQAAADGRRAARAIARRLGIAEPGATETRRDIDPVALLVRKSRRLQAEPWPEQRPAEPDFQVHPPRPTTAQVQREAERCLDCDLFCSLCTTVCPNRANLFYRCRPFQCRLPAYAVRAGRLESTEERDWQVSQSTQVLNIADWCNACGNCETFCPSAGAPYRDKPRLCLSDESFADEQRAYRLTRTADGWRLEHKEPAGLHRLTLAAGRLRYRSPKIEAELTSDFRVEQIGPGPDALEGERLSLEPAARMLVLGRSLAADAIWLPGLARG